MFFRVLGQARTQKDKYRSRGSVREQGGTLGAKKYDLPHRTIHKALWGEACVSVLFFRQGPSLTPGRHAVSTLTGPCHAYHKTRRQENLTKLHFAFRLAPQTERVWDGMPWAAL